MKLSKQDILKLAKLNKLKISENEIQQYQNELSSILDYITQLGDVDVSGLKPTYQVTGLTTLDENTTREDEVLDQVTHDELLKNVPVTEDGHIKVKRMIG